LEKQHDSFCEYGESEDKPNRHDLETGGVLNMETMVHEIQVKESVVKESLTAQMSCFVGAIWKFISSQPYFPPMSPPVDSNLSLCKESCL